MILRESRGEVDAVALHAYLREREARLDLDFDIAWANQFILDDLAACFPEARFIALVRHPHAWIGSVIGHLLSRDIPQEVRGFLDWWFMPEDHPHTAQDEALKARGLYSTAAFLGAWKRHVDICMPWLDSERFLLLKTHELSTSHGRIADFLRIPTHHLHAPDGHLNRGRWEGRAASLIEPAYLAEAVDRICGPHVRELFPEHSA